MTGDDDRDRRSALRRLAWAVAFFAVALGTFVLVFAVGLFH